MSGHGHVTPNADGSRARCGGPKVCGDCAIELANAIKQIQDQPPPIAQPTNTPVWELVVDDAARMFGDSKGYNPTIIAAMLADMRMRDTIGRDRYGTPLTTHNGRDHLVDAYQESLDMAVYLRAEIAEKGANYCDPGLHTIYHSHLLNVAHLHAVIIQRPRSVVSG